MLMVMGRSSEIACPFTNDPPPSAISIGVMPKYLRAAFVQAYKLRSEERKGEAEIFEEAISELMQEHFKNVIAHRRRRGAEDIGQFYLGRDWKVYAMPLRQ